MKIFYFIFIIIVFVSSALFAQSNNNGAYLYSGREKSKLKNIKGQNTLIYNNGINQSAAEIDEIINVEGTLWQRIKGEKLYFLAPSVKDPENYFSSFINNSEKDKNTNYRFSFYKIELTEYSKSILPQYGIFVPDYIANEVLIYIPRICFTEIFLKGIDIFEYSYGRSPDSQRSFSARRGQVIWAEGFEGSMSPYTITGNPQWNDIDCDSYEGSWSLFCNSIDPCDEYENGMTTSIYINDGIDVSDFDTVQFSFKYKHDLEDGYDFLYRYYSGDGINWTLSVLDYTGTSNNYPNWDEQLITAVGFSTYYWRFSFVSDNTIVDDGVYIDDMEISSLTPSMIPPSLLFPLHNSSISQIVPRFEFRPVIGANLYSLQVSTTSTFSNIISDALWQVSSLNNSDTLKWFPGIVNPADYQPGRNYYWRIKAFNTQTGTESPWSAEYKYTTTGSIGNISAPSPSTPLNNSSLFFANIDFTWSVISNSTWYQLQWSNSSTFTTFQYRWIERNSPNYLAYLSPQLTYYWRVIAYNNSSISNFSTTRSFYTTSQISYVANESNFDDGSGALNYSNDLEVYYLIQPPDASKIFLSFLSFETEEQFDYVTVYDGPNAGYPILGTFSGEIIPPQLQSTQGAMTIKFITDGSITKPGWTISYTSNITGVKSESNLPSVFSLSQNYPNPFNPKTIIKYDVPEAQFITIKLFDLLGREIMNLVNEKRDAGRHQIEVDGSDIPSGVYYYTLTAGSFSATKKLILIK